MVQSAVNKFVYIFAVIESLNDIAIGQGSLSAPELDRPLAKNSVGQLQAQVVADGWRRAGLRVPIQ